MKATKENFRKLMNGLSTSDIIALIRKTWNDGTGTLFREIGFDIIEEREGEADADRIYNELWHLENRVS